jgi:2,4-dienoyl-CoA reductase-like NADH-dependent reductase (Old Yellow Enzyme family)
MDTYRKAGTFRSVAELREYLASNDIDIPLAEETEHAAMAQSAELFGCTLPNRWALLPMEGWDCTAKGAPSELTVRRWTHFGESGAALICGTEAGAVMHEGRSNPRQLLVTRENLPELKAAVAAMRKAHAERYGTAGDFLVGLQLTHSGRFAHPNRDDKLESAVAWTHPLLDRKFGAPRVVTDSEIGDIVRAYGEAARVAREAGFDFVDLKHAHGYLAHDFLTAYDRPGPYGGSFENRTRFSREMASRVKEACPDLPIAMRLSIFDILPFEKNQDGVGRPMVSASQPPRPFGAAGDCLSMDPDLEEPTAFLEMMRQYGVELVCGTIGSPYYSVHIQRPAYFPVCDGYLPPQDPLRSVALHIAAARRLKERCPWAKIILSGITCLQEYAGCAAEAAVAPAAAAADAVPSSKFLVPSSRFQPSNRQTVKPSNQPAKSAVADFAGLGRMALSYPEYCADHLAGGKFDRRRICRTFGECTNAPRHGCVSGCYPLDVFYKTLEKGLN